MSVSTYPTNNRCDSGLIEDFCGSQLDAIMLVAKNMSLLQQIPDLINVAQSIYTARDDAQKAEQGAIAAMDGVPEFAEMALYSMNIFPNIDTALTLLPNGAFFMVPAGDDKPQNFGNLYQVQAGLAKFIKTLPSSVYILSLQNQITLLQGMLTGYGFADISGYLALLNTLPTEDPNDPNQIWNNNGIITQGSGTIPDDFINIAAKEGIDAISVKGFISFLLSLPTENTSDDTPILWNNGGVISYGTSTDSRALVTKEILDLLNNLPKSNTFDPNKLWNNDGVITQGFIPK